MKISIHQPLFIPWIGYFDKINKADIFVILDHVQYTKGSWINRNKIKMANNEILLTIPVIKTALNTPINAIKIDFSKKWIRKHLDTIKYSYKKAPYFDEIYLILENSYMEKQEYLALFNQKLIEIFCEYLEIHTKIIKSSELNVSGNKSQLLLNICKELKADTYIIGMGGNNNYIDFELFKKNNIKIQPQQFHHPTYPQLGKDFIPNLSIIDLLFNKGKDSIEIL
jgi:hypothetical protein